MLATLNPTLTKNSNFPFENLYNRYLGVINEFNCSESQRENCKKVFDNKQMEFEKINLIDVTNTVTNGKDKRKSAINAAQFVDAGIASAFVVNQQRWSFWNDVKNLLNRKKIDWKEFCDSIEKCCVEFQNIRNTYDLPAIPYMNIYDKMESGLAEFC